MRLREVDVQGRVLRKPAQRALRGTDRAKRDAGATAALISNRSDKGAAVDVAKVEPVRILRRAYRLAPSLPARRQLLRLVEGRLAGPRNVSQASAALRQRQICEPIS